MLGSKNTFSDLSNMPTLSLLPLDHSILQDLKNYPPTSSNNLKAIMYFLAGLLSLARRYKSDLIYSFWYVPVNVSQTALVFVPERPSDIISVIHGSPIFQKREIFFLHCTSWFFQSVPQKRFPCLKDVNITCTVNHPGASAPQHRTKNSQCNEVG